LEPFTRINKLERDSVSHLEYWSSLVASMDLVGVEPITFYCFGTSKKPTQRDFLLLTLTKLFGRKPLSNGCSASLVAFGQQITTS
jgi:hypothetical protein